MDSNLCLLNIGAHPADVVADAGGTTILHTDRGDRVVVVTLTGGTRVHDKVLDEYRKADELPDEAEMAALFEKRTAVKRQEVVDACRVLGVDEVHFMGYDEQLLFVTEKLVLELAALIRRVRPDIVITHFPFDSNGLANDHTTTGQITMHAIKAAGGILVGDTHPPHTGADLQQPFAKCLRLNRRSHTAAQRQANQRAGKRIRQRRQPQPHVIGANRRRVQAIGKQLQLLFLDAIFGFAARAVLLLIQLGRRHYCGR